MKKIILFSLLVPCINYFGFSQVEKQVIITKNGQSKTIELISSPSTSQFKVLIAMEDGSQKAFTPADISSFVFPDGRKFISTKIRGSQELIFMQLPFEGEVSLGYYGNIFHLLVKDEAIPLTVDSRADFASESRQLKRKTYLGVLHFGLGGCKEEVNAQINETNLSYPALEKLLIAYHECKGIPYQVHGNDQKSLKVGFSAAIGYSQIQPNLDEVRYLTQPAGARIEVLVNFVSQKFTPRLRTETGFAFTQFDQLWGIGMRNLPPGKQQDRYEEVAQIRAIDIPFLVNYSLIKSNNHDLYLGLGFKFTVHQKELISEISQFELRQESPPYDLATRPKDPIFINMDNRPGGLVKLGYSIKVSGLALFTEIQADLIAKAGFLQLTNQGLAVYSYNSFTGKIGVRF